MAVEKLNKPSYLEGNSKTDAVSATEKPSEAPKPVVQGKVSHKKQPVGKRLRESLGLEETRTVGDYLVWDVLVPALKDTVAEVVKKGIDVFLYGGTSSAPKKGGKKSHVSYEGYYSGSNRGDYKSYKGDRRASTDFRDFVFDERRDADVVLNEMCEIVDTYGFCKVSDFYSLVGETERTYTDHGYGWDALGSASVERVRDGWVLDLPRPIPLN